MKKSYVTKLLFFTTLVLFVASLQSCSCEPEDDHRRNYKLYSPTWPLNEEVLLAPFTTPDCPIAENLAGIISLTEANDFDEIIYENEDPGGDHTIQGSHAKWRFNLDIAGPCSDDDDEDYDEAWGLGAFDLDKRTVIDFGSETGDGFYTCVDPAVVQNNGFGESYNVTWTFQSKSFEISSCSCTPGPYTFNFNASENLALGIYDEGCDEDDGIVCLAPWNIIMTCLRQS